MGSNRLTERRVALGRVRAIRCRSIALQRLMDFRGPDVARWILEVVSAGLGSAHRSVQDAGPANFALRRKSCGEPALTGTSRRA